MKKIVCFMLLFSFIAFSSSYVTYAAESDVVYDAFVDDVVGFIEPRFAFEYIPVLEYENKFLIFEWGEAKELAWDISNVSFYCTLNNLHAGESLVGYNPSDLEFVFEYQYASVDDALNEYTTSSVFVYPYSDVELVGDYMELTFPYSDILSQCEYYTSGYDTVLKSVDIFVRSKVLNTCGTIVHYEFYCDDISSSIYTGIDYYETDTNDMHLKSTLARSFKGDDDGLGDGNGGAIETHYYVTVLPDSVQEMAFELNDLFTVVFVQVPIAVLNALQFLVMFIFQLPSLISIFLPFLPEWVVAAIMYTIIFIFVVFGLDKVWKLLKK